jgi:hypothetical protein
MSSDFTLVRQGPGRRNPQPHDWLFEYRSINGDIRLVTLEHGNKTDDVRCEMFNVKFSTDPTYVALSYEWGGIGKHSRIRIDGGLCKVGLNLFNALVHLREPDKDVVLWVDALYINQQDLGERNRQVELMGNIYLRATEVVIWLGLARDDSDLVMADFNSNTAVLMKAESTLSWCRRTYWRRMWVIQEIQLAKDLSIYCGTERIKWSAFSRKRQLIVG